MGYILRVRTIAKACCASYLEHVVGDEAGRRKARRRKSWPNQTLTFEIGTEELPAFDSACRNRSSSAACSPTRSMARAFPMARFRDVLHAAPPYRDARYAVPEATEASTEDLPRPCCARSRSTPTATPRRLPWASRAARALTRDALERRDENGTEYVYAVKIDPVGAGDHDLLPDVLAEPHHRHLLAAFAALGLAAASTSAARFAGSFAMLGDAVVPVEFAGLTAGNTHHVVIVSWHPARARSLSADALIDVLRAAQRGAHARPSVRLPFASRSAAIEAEDGPCGRASREDAWLEVVNLAEFPTVMVGDVRRAVLGGS